MEPTSASSNDLICAIATPPGQGGIGVIRLSGQGAKTLAETLCQRKLPPRYAVYSKLTDSDQLLDDGICLFFPGPNSFTGEDVVEIQGHGGPVVQHAILNVLCRKGARMARPGEFSERAFLNGKLDLVQAEAIADLISAQSEAAAKAALSTMTGEFSRQINGLAERMINLRILIEAAIDFPEEDIEILEQADAATKIQQMSKNLEHLINVATQGKVLNQGISVVLVGAPNVGKSSLLNALAGEDTAIVTDVPGTTRDVLKVDLVIEGLPIQIVDTAGLRDSDDKVERIGIERAKEQIHKADAVVLVMAADTLEQTRIERDVRSVMSKMKGNDPASGNASSKLFLAVNKSDLVNEENHRSSVNATFPEALPRPYQISAKTKQGLDQLVKAVAGSVTFDQDHVPFSARQRHIQALEQTRKNVQQAGDALAQGMDAEFIAEELIMAHLSLGEIVGTLSADDLLGKIFAEFCIGK